MDIKNKVLLMILDGWGIGPKDFTNAIHLSDTPFIDSLEKNYPSATLRTDGLNVGLPEGQMGNSEVGHLNIGAGRVVYQDLVRINRSIETGEFFRNPVLLEAMERSKSEGTGLHLMGLVSDGGVHSSQEHLHALLDLASDMGHDKVFVHAFTDGRDTDPKSGLEFIKSLENKLLRSGGTLATVVGRYYAMDRDLRWERIKVAYDAMVHGLGAKTTHFRDELMSSYNRGVTDEFVLPIIATDIGGRPVGRILPGDTVICFNFRTDRCREMTRALTQGDFPSYGMKAIDIRYITMTNYDSTFERVGVVFEKDNLNDTLGEVVSAAGGTQLRMAETEKYPHVTFFFNGGREDAFPGESRIMVPSPKVATYDLQPEMSAPEVAATAVSFMEDHRPNFVCLNFANPDMVGHTGVFSAIVKACETIDRCAESVCGVALRLGYEILIIADHGNADKAINPDGSPNTAHSTHPVPMYLLTERKGQLESGILADVAPTILALLGISQPETMTGKNLFSPEP